jgi:23S rRNA G2069 N7-methylase RlmK/C1962 C5-methylase RlmI
VSPPPKPAPASPTSTPPRAWSNGARKTPSSAASPTHPIRYIADDCLKFVRREQKRGKFYDAIIMDPPTYGRGATGEMWKLEEHLWPLLTECRALLTPSKPLFFS